MRILTAAALSALSFTPAFADETQGLILAYDREAHILVLQDMTVWELPTTVAVPDDLGAGDRVVLTYETAGEDGLTSIDALLRTATSLPEGTDGGS